ncbi:MAG: hypothetical protein ACO3IB_04970 [Phycisphaerales bacterium]
MHRTTLIATGLMSGAALFTVSAAGAQEIVSAVFRASAQYCGYARFIELPAADVPEDDCADVSIECGTTSLALSACFSNSGFTVSVQSAMSASPGIPLAVTAGPEGAVVRCEASGIEAFSKKGEPFGGGEMLIPAGATATFVVAWSFAPTTEGTASLTVLSGALSAAQFAEFGGLDSSDGTDPTWTCTAEREWSFSMADLACAAVPCHDANPDCGGQDGVGTADLDEISAEVFGGGPNASIELTCEFVLSEAAVLRYEVEGGPYCDPSFLDGSEVAFDPDENCSGESGYLCLNAGTHTLRVYNYDLGDSSLRLVVQQGACADCNNNGMADRNEIDWDIRFGDGNLDTNGNLELDSCERARGDLDLDGVVGSKDLAILLTSWGGTGGDLTGDGFTNAIDLGILLAAWG